MHKRHMLRRHKRGRHKPALQTSLQRTYAGQCRPMQVNKRADGRDNEAAAATERGIREGGAAPCVGCQAWEERKAKTKKKKEKRKKKKEKRKKKKEKRKPETRDNERRRNGGTKKNDKKERQQTKNAV